MELYGNISTDVELTMTSGGAARVNFGVAHNPRQINADGKWQDGTPLFFYVTAWRALAEGIAAAMKKGDPIVVVGTWKATERGEGDKRERLQWFEATAAGPNLKFVDATLTKRAPAAAKSVPAAEEARPVEPTAPNPFDE